MKDSLDQEYGPRLPIIISAHKTKTQQPIVYREVSKDRAPNYINSMTLG